MRYFVHFDYANAKARHIVLIKQQGHSAGKKGKLRARKRQGNEQKHTTEYNLNGIFARH